MLNIWKVHQDENPETSDIVQHGIDKLESYSSRTDMVSAYTLAMSSYFIDPLLLLISFLVQFWIHLSN
jgi:hypothetical protein